MNIDEYIAAQPERQQALLTQIREVAHSVIPGGEETISYGVPTVRSGGKNVVHFGGFRDHVSVYPVPEDLPAELKPFVKGKGTISFPLDKPLPAEHIRLAIELLLIRARGVR